MAFRPFQGETRTMEPITTATAAAVVLQGIPHLIDAVRTYFDNRNAIHGIETQLILHEQRLGAQLRSAEATRELSLLDLAQRARLGREQMISGLAATGISAVTQIYNGRRHRELQERLARQAAELQERLRREQAEQARELTTHRTDEDLRRARELTELNLYPIAQGPGHLARSLELAYPDRATRPPLLLLSPAGENDGKGTPWEGLTRRIEMSLRPYHRDGLIRPWIADRPFQWPHHRLYTEDLAGSPTIVMNISVARERLEIRLGGAHLDLDAPGPVQDAVATLPLAFPDPAVWTPELVARLNATAVYGQRFQVPGDDPRLLAVLNHELAARAAALYAVAVMDCYHLIRTTGYRERIDQALAATALVGDEWPVETGVPLWRMADPAYHLLHRAARHLRRGDPAAAELAVCQALSILSGHDEVRLDATAADLAASAAGGPLMRDHHWTMLQEVLGELAGSGAPGAEPARRALGARPPRPGHRSDSTDLV